MKRKANVHIIATGGTIAGRADSAAATVGYKAGELTVGQLIASVPGLDKLANLSGEQLCNIDSKDMQEAIWLQLAERVEAAAERKDVDGIVITHGTDTLEETAFILQLTVKTDKPIVLTGAMRPATAISADGPMNIWQSVSHEHLAVCAGRGRQKRNRARRTGGDERADPRGGNRYKSQRQRVGSIPVPGKGTDGRYDR